MKRTMILCLVVSLIMLGGFATFLYMMSRSTDEMNHQRRMLENEEIGVLAIQGEQYSRSMSNSTKIEVLGVAGEDVNVLTFPVDSIEQVYEEGHSTKVDGQLSRMREKKEYSFENPLLSYNPYGTNPLSMYIYFKTQSECLVKYTISTQDEDMPDFTRTLQDTNGMGYANHEYSIVGFSPDVVNYLYLELQTMDGNYIDSKVYEIYIPGSGYGNPTRINTTYSDRVQDISNGLYFVYSSDKTSIALYDNAGYLRGEIPLVQGTGIPAIIGDASFTLATSPQSISRITSTGYVSTTVSIPGYSIRESMVDNGMGQILAIASESGRKTVRDTIISIDFTTGAVNKNLDVKKLLRKYYKKNKASDWIGLNAMVYMDGGRLLLCSDKTNSIIAIQNIMTANPTLQYILGNQKSWDVGKLSSYCYTKSEDEGSATTSPEPEIDSIFIDKTIVVDPFEDMMSPVSLTYTKMQEMERYFLHFMNNGTGDLTEYWCFSVNEMDQTYMLRKRKALEQNEVGGSLVLNGENIIANAMSQAKFSEYTSGGECVATYEIKGERIDKNSMKGFWFQ